MKFSKIASFSLMAVVILVMVTATVVDKWSGSAMGIYGSWWFATLWALLAVAALVYIFRSQMHHRPVLLLLHLSLALILTGACVTRIWGMSGIVHLRMGYPCRTIELDDSHYEKLPFTLQLSSFDVEHYPGTQTPMDYVSIVHIAEVKDTASYAQMRISMNRIGTVQGYRFYQSAYDPDERGTILSVSYDPWGIGISYAGYGLLFLSMILLLILPNEGFRKALRRLSVVLLFGLTFLPASAMEPQVLPDSLASKFGDLYAYYNGRVCPLQTVARDFTTKLYGKDSYNGYSAEQVFSGWILFPSTWKEVPFKQRKGERYEVEQQAIVQMLINGEFLFIYPYASTSGMRWLSQSSELPLDMDEDDWMFVRKSMDYVGELAVTRQFDRLSFTLDKLRKYQIEKAAALGEDILPSDARFKAEKIYNLLQYSRLLAMVFVALGLLLFFLFLRSWLLGRKVASWLQVAVNFLMIVACLYQLAVLFLRGFVSGHLPLSNGYETMQFMAWVVMILSLLLQRRFVLMLPFGYLLTGLTLLVSMMGEGNPQITPLMPVLQSPLLSLHVCIVMLAYSLLAIIFFNGLTALCLKDAKKVEQLQLISRVLLYPALFCLAAGIFIGAIWANVSWGRYWGWDPKEVWALITMLVYSFALHGKSLSWFRKPKFFHLFLVLAFLCVLMTYFGVNYLLGGMHSYANG